MATTKPRIYVFYGSDTHASLQATRAWNTLFLKKYSDSSLFNIEADELTTDTLLQQCITALETVTLFPTPKLIIIKRASSHDKNQSNRVAQTLVDIIEQRIWILDENITLVFWEDKRLADTHPLIKKMGGWQKLGIGQVREFKLPDKDIRKLVQSYLAEKGFTVEPGTLQYLRDQYVYLEQESRLQQRLKAGDELKTDLRGWWLYGALDGAILRSSTNTISIEDVKEGVEELIPPFNIFAFSQSLGRGDWKEARLLAHQAECLEMEDSAYFSLYAAIRWTSQRTNAGRSSAIMQLLSEIELLTKNISISHAWILDLLITRLETHQKTGELAPLITPRTLWLSQLPRS